MEQQLSKIHNRFQELIQLINDPALLAEAKTYAKLQKEYSELAKIVHIHQSYQQIKAEILTTRELLQNNEEGIRELAREELHKLQKEEEQLQQTLKELLLPKDPNDSKNSILEIRAGIGGQEAAIWAGDLFRMYQRLAEKKKWTMEVLDYTESTSGGFKEIITVIKGEDVYAMLKYESGVHRVQRVPDTETQGRIHTSAVSVAVLPEVDEVEVDINMKDIRKDTFCSSGPGGQSVNTTYSAIRLTHIPTGIVVSCQDEKSQLKNFDKAMKVLRSRLYDKAQKAQQEEIGATRKSMIGSGDRSEKIRTYNYPQARITDHRINYSQHNLAAVLEGELDNFIEALRVAECTSKISEQMK